MGAIPLRAQSEMPPARFEFVDLSTIEGATSVASVLQCRKGFMWFATNRGLIRFDGVRTLVFRHDPEDPHSLPSDRLWRLFEDRDGAIWVGTDRGLARFNADHESVERIPLDSANPESFANSHVIALGQDQAGKIWAGTVRDGAFRIDPNHRTSQRYQHVSATEGSLPYGRIENFALGPQGRLWVATGTGLVRFQEDTNNFERIFAADKRSEALTYGSMRQIYFDRNGRLWLGFSDGLAYCDPKQPELRWWRPKENGNPAIKGHVYGITEDHFGRLWIARYHGDLVLLDQDREFLGSYDRQFGNDANSLGGALDCLFTDRDGGLWVGTFKNGVYHYQPEVDLAQSFYSYRLAEEAFSPGLVHGALEEADGSILMCGQSGVRRLHADGRLEDLPLPVDSGMGMSPNIWQMELGQNGTVWASTTYGLMKLREDGRTWEVIESPDALKEHFDRKRISALAWQEGVGLWIGTVKGVYLWNPETEQSTHYFAEGHGEHVLAHQRIYEILVRNPSELWISTEDRLYLVSSEGKVLQSFGLPGNEQKEPWKVTTMTQDADGALWAIDDSGVSVLDPGANAFLRIPNPGKDRSWRGDSILAAADGSMLVGFTRGIKRLAPGERRFDDRMMRLHGGHYGSISRYPWQRANGEVLYPGQAGLFVLRSLDFPEAAPPPKVVITDVQLFHETLGGAALQAPLDFSYDQNHVSFSFAALQFARPHLNRYQVRLEGFEEQWRSLGAATDVSYPNLPQGDYVFHVRAAGPNGRWRAESTSIAFHIQTPYWLTWWFRIGTLVVVVAGALLVHQVRLRNVQKRNQHLEELHREALRETAERKRIQENLAITMDSIADGVVSIGEDFRIRSMNPVAAKLLGRPFEELEGCPIQDACTFLSIPSGEPLLEPMLSRTGPQEPLALPERGLLRNHHGQDFQVAISAAPILHPTGEHLGTVLVFRDITERIALESQLAQAQKMESLGRLAGGIAHDFNNMLTSIQGYADLLREELNTSAPDSHKSERYLSAVIQSTARGTDLIGQLLAFSRQDASKTEVLDMHELLAGVAQVLERTLHPGILIKQQFDAPQCAVHGNQGTLESVFLNLGINAGDVMPKGGSLRFQTGLISFATATPIGTDGLDPGDYLEIKVSDTGGGMDERLRERIFEPFFTTKEVGHGTGLGLSTALSTVRGLGGTIAVHSEVGRGTTMRVLLPLAVDQEPFAAVGAAKKASKGEGTVLLIEDDEAVMDLCDGYLESLGYELITAVDGEKGLELFEQHRGQIDVVILDYLMPGKTGEQVLTAIRESGSGVPVLMMTGFSMGVTASELLERGADAVLDKPFLPADLSERVASLLRPKEPFA